MSDTLSSGSNHLCTAGIRRRYELNRQQERLSNMTCESLDVNVLKIVAENNLRRLITGTDVIEQLSESFSAVCQDSFKWFTLIWRFFRHAELRIKGKSWLWLGRYFEFSCAILDCR
ncbi:hypothetical protein BaRGS_00036028 [Batillaria attramentaria]|uniref:Uncharacterized protein n=1 Tax=Batillaria attramentaria TaxID=370345 RepID=A0ABD0JD62_9CAEN